MSRGYITSAFAGALLLGLDRCGFGRDRRIQQHVHSGARSRQGHQTDCSINGQIEGKTYCFGSQQAKTDLSKDPKGNMAKAQAYYMSKHPG